MSLYTKLQASCPRNSSTDSLVIGIKFWIQVRSRVCYAILYQTARATQEDWDWHVPSQKKPDNCLLKENCYQLSRYLQSDK